MSIEYRPPALERIIADPRSERRLRNREGQAWYLDAEQNERILIQEGPILEVNSTAIQFGIDNPHHPIIVEEYSCGSLIVAPTESDN